MNRNNKVKGVIFDIDGTLIFNNRSLPGAIDAIAILRKVGVLLRFVTNTTGRTSEQLSSMLSELGFDIQSSEIMTSVTACIRFVHQTYPDSAGFLAIPEGLKAQFSEVKQTKENPAFVVLGDLGEAFNYAVLNRVFNYMRNGAQLITFHRNPFFFREGKTWLDSGAFTIAFESITKQKAVITGKPAPMMFRNALSSMELKKKEVLVIGDDASTDIVGARNADMAFLLVGTGKFKQEDLDEYEIDSKYVISDLSKTTTILNALNAGQNDAYR